MRNLYLIISMVIAGYSSGQVFSEDFQGLNGTFPPGWNLINGDALIPAVPVSYINDAWIIHDYFVSSTITDSYAISASWYSPVGTSNDWMITPQILDIPPNCALSWKAIAPDISYADGYQVWVSTVGNTQENMLDGTMIFSTSGEASIWTSHSINLNAFSDQNIYIGFRNNSVDKFILLVDDILVDLLPDYDVSMSMPKVNEYAITPLAHMKKPLGSNGYIDNAGAGTVTNVFMTAKVYDGTMTNVYSGNSSITPSLLAAETMKASVPGFLPLLADIYTIELISRISEFDANLSNNIITYKMTISDSVYARDDGILTGSLSIGTGSSGYLGQMFHAQANDEITSASAFFAHPKEGDSIKFHVFETFGDQPTSIIDSTDTYVFTAADVNFGVFVTKPFKTPVAISASTNYLLAVAESIGSGCAIGTSTSNVTPKTNYIYFNGLWATSEYYGYPVQYILRANLGSTCAPTSSTESVASCHSYFWPETGKTYTSSGIFKTVVLNAEGCDSTITLELTINHVDVTTSVTAGAVSANATAATYQWIDCRSNNSLLNETNQDYSPLETGLYAVIVTQNGCTDTSDCVFWENVRTLSNNLVIFPNPSNGQLIVRIEGLVNSEIGIHIVDASGKLVMKESYLSNEADLEIQLNLSNVENGIYLIKISAGDKQVIERIAINKNN